MPTDPPAKADLAAYSNGWLLSRLRRMKSDRDLAGKIIRVLNSEERDEPLSVNKIAEASGHPRTTVQRWASNTTAATEEHPQ